MKHANKILIVDDEQDIIEFLRYNLLKEGYEVATAFDGKMAIEVAETEMPDLIILDIMMPELDGIETCKALRKKPKFKDTLIVFLTAKDSELYEIEGLEIGADDYITKPIKPKVLISRIKALLRRHKSSELTFVEIKDLQIDIEKYEVKKAGEVLYLPRKEFELLTLLASKPGKVFKREEIYNTVWGPEVIVTDRTIDVHIRKLREKIGDGYIKTVKGIGYKLQD